MKWPAIILVACALAALGTQARGASAPPDTARADEPGTPQNPPVPVMTSASGSTQDDPVRVLLVADRETTLSSTIAAKITMLNADIGMAFKAGQTLVGFDCRDVRARLNMAKAELAGAVETHKAKIRMQGLEQAADVEVALATSAVDKAKAQVELHEAQLAQCTVTAPWPGRVAKVYVRNYMSVTPGQPLLDLVKSGPLRIKLNLPSRELGQIRIGTLFDVIIDETGKTYQARVVHINSRADAVSQTVEVEAVMVGNHPELLPGMSGTMKLKGMR